MRSGSKGKRGKIITLLLIVVVILGIMFEKKDVEKNATYPEMATYPKQAEFTDEKTGEIDQEEFSRAHAEWRKQQQLRQKETYEEANIKEFIGRTVPVFLNEETQGNRVYSPVSIYLALSILSELTEDECQKELLNFLGYSDIDSLREQATGLWKAHYNNDGKTTLILASSLWLSDEINCDRGVLDILASSYFMSAFQGAVGSEKFNMKAQEWLSEQTGNLLASKTNNFQLDPEAAITLITTTNFQAKWKTEFQEGNTRKGFFQAESEQKICDFMKETTTGEYYWADTFSAVAKSFDGNERMLFILPDEGVLPSDLFEDGEFLEFLYLPSEWEQKKTVTVNIEVPKFDMTTQMELREPLESLGIKSVFDGRLSQFGPLTKENGLAVSKIEHSSRIIVDEEGCTAASYTSLPLLTATAPSSEEVDFILNRPFVFVITGNDDVPLFIGVVNCP